jgi:serine/threonine-protein kinase
MIGKRLLGKWEVLSKIGAGGFGTVYKVRDVRLNHVEALKVFDRRRLHPDEAEEALARFQREAMLLKPLGIKSQHIVGLSAFEEDPEEGLLYFTMEYVDGENLSQLLIKDGPLPWLRAFPIMDQVLDALITAHEDDIVHRDMKLENIMITKDKRGDDVAKVLDFGIAKPLGQQSLTNLALGGPGTPGYAAPEQLEAGEIDQRTDLFALGVVYYGVLTGREPWLGGVITEPTSKGLVIMTQTLKGDPIPPRKWNEDIPEWVETFIFKLMEKRPEDRFQTAYELREFIRDHMRGPAPQVAVTPDFASLTVTTVDPSSGGIVDGVAIRVRRGRKVVAEGRSPWTADSLEPGRYEIEIRDSSYEMDSREVDLVVGSVADVKLNSVVKVQDLGAVEIVAYGDEEGVEVRLRQGRKTVAEGLTPWVNEELVIGEYEVQVVDKRFKRTSRHIRIAKGETTTAKMGLKEATFWDNFGNYIMAGGGTVAAAIIIGVTMSGGGDGGAAIPVEDFRAALEAGDVSAARVRNGRVSGFLNTADGEAAYQVDLAGVPLQDLVRRLEGAGILGAATGEGSVIFRPVDAETSEVVNESIEVTLSDAEASAICEGPCPLGQEVPVSAGFYTLGSQLGGQFVLQGMILRDPEQVYAEEALAADATRFFVPGDDQVEVLVRLGRSQLGLNLQEARSALTAGNLRSAVTYLRSVRQEDPSNATAGEIAADIARAAIGADDPNSARDAIQELSAIDASSSQIQVLLSGLGDLYASQADRLLESGGNWSLPLGLCDTYVEGHARCASVRGRAEAQSQQQDPNEEVTETVARRTPDDLADEQLAAARRALARNDLDGAGAAANDCLAFRAGDSACQGILDTIGERQAAAALQRQVDGYLNNARERLASANFEGARQAIANCIRMDAGNASCQRFEADIDAAEARETQLRDLRTRAQTELAARRYAEARTLAGECLALAANDSSCRDIDSRAQQAERDAADAAAAESRRARADSLLRAAQAALSGNDLAGADRMASECLGLDSGRTACQTVRDDVAEVRSRPAAPAVAGLSIVRAGMQGDEIGRTAEVVLGFTASGPPNTSFCVAAFFSASDGRTLRPKSDEYTVGGRVATYQVLALTSNSQQEAAYSLTLPADELRIENTGDHRLSVEVGIWSGSCPPSGPPSGAMSNAVAQTCIARDFGGDWYPECGEERPDR